MVGTDKLGAALLKKGLLSEAQLDEALDVSRKTFEPLATVLMQMGLVAESDLLRTLGERHGLAFAEMASLTIEAAAVKAVSAKLATHYRVMPIRIRGNVLTLAVSNPLDMSPVEDIEANLGYRVERILACRADISETLRRHYGVGAETVERILAGTESRESEEVEAEESQDLEKMAEDASVVRLVNQFLQKSITDRATDIHLELQHHDVTLRRRIDGVLYDLNVPKNIRALYPAIVSRIKLMSGLNIVERRLPQDGRARVKVGSGEYDLRVSVVPAIHGEDIVVRVLPATMLFDLSQLGLSEAHRRDLEGVIHQPHGIFLVTGPTGSGKSTTLYACLSRLNTRDHKIITIEDPVEYELKGITQTQVNAKIGLSFAMVLRSMLRHDPDVMMVGEIRDRETAEIATQAAMTGHLVFSTLHTNDAASGPVRLTDMGIAPYLISSTVICFMAQRLVRVICVNCREPYEKNGQSLFRGRGCARCSQSGFFGRIAVCEFLQMRREIQTLVLEHASAQAIRAKADELGMSTLAADGWAKVAAGVTTAEEVLRVTSL